MCDYCGGTLRARADDNPEAVAQRLADATSVPVHLVDAPLECVVQGAGQCLESFDRLKRLFTEDD